MTKQDFIKSKLAELKKIVYGDDPGLEVYGEHEKLEKFCLDFIEDLREIANRNSEKI